MKVERAVEQVIKKLNAETSSGDYFQEEINRLLRCTYFNNSAFERAMKEEMKNRVVQIVLKNVEVAE